MKLLQQICRKVLQELSELDKPVEQRTCRAEAARYTVRIIFDADGNIRILTLDRVAKTPRYTNISDSIAELQFKKVLYLLSILC